VLQEEEAEYREQGEVVAYLCVAVRQEAQEVAVASQEAPLGEVAAHDNNNGRERLSQKIPTRAMASRVFC